MGLPLFSTMASVKKSEAIKKLLQDWSVRKRWVVFGGFFFSLIFITSFTGWIYSLPRNLNLFLWSPMFKYISWFFVGIAIIIPIITIGDIGIRLMKEHSPTKIPGKYVYALIIAGILIPSGFLFYLTPYYQHGDKPPELLIIDQTGSYGVPDLAVVFYSGKETTNILEYGVLSTDLDVQLSEIHKSNVHAFVLSDLLPDTRYFYQINGEGQIYNFTSFPLTDFHFAISSDAHIGASTNNLTVTEEILTQITSPSNGYDAFFNLGDMVENGFSDKLYREKITLFSPYTSHIPYRPVLGNHDGLFGGFSYWEDYFYPSTLPSESSNSTLWHRFDFGTNMHIFMLDLEWGTETYTDAQKFWFEAELAALDPDDWIIVMSHAFYYASSTYYDDIPWFDNPDMIATFQSLFAANGVDLVLSGHDHQMEHMSQEGVDYFIIGGLGGVFDKNATVMTAANSHFYNNTNHGFLDLQFLGNSVTASFRTPGNDILYTTDIQK